VHKSLNAMNFCRLQKHVGAKNIVLGELKAVSKGVVHMSLCCKVHDRVNLFRFENVIYEIRRTNIALEKKKSNLDE
jgi:hypothetical protein